VEAIPLTEDTTLLSPDIGPVIRRGLPLMPEQEIILDLDQTYARAADDA
jgi:hypothetical protein